ncbi:helix-turn-helix domain-containing protein [Yersinia frederiksenii]|uniref:helix-turn-helix domain-containing protein n=1 Tax=Yersinia frederiksenii TaxID=29484 RepID=UPI0005E2058C|nr:helix-turn-helix transcriptional regulator [Yersinia frederiksenii]CQJ02370.1 Helix-turn-helix domain [Yersinia frederiksenii]
MKNESLYFTEREKNSDGHSKVYASEELTFNVTEDLLIIMEDKDISKSELAYKLGKTKAYVSQLLSGSKNMTLKTMSDVCFALGIKPVVDFHDKDSLIISDNMIKSFLHTSWETYYADDHGEYINEGHTAIVSKSNIIYKPKHFWEKVAA